jgi:hypothetical protein
MFGFGFDDSRLGIDGSTGEIDDMTPHLGDITGDPVEVRGALGDST